MPDQRISAEAETFSEFWLKFQITHVAKV
jgi:hypothetical protein